MLGPLLGAVFIFMYCLVPFSLRRDTSYPEKTAQPCKQPGACVLTLLV